MPVPTILDAALPLVRRRRLALLFENHLIGRWGATVTADSEDAAGKMPATNLLTENKHEPWRSGSVATRAAQPTPTIVVTFALPQPRAFDWISYAWSNNLLRWQGHFYAGDPGAGGELRGSSEWTAPVVRSDAADFELEDFPWALGPTDERLLELAADRRLNSFAHLTETLYGIDHVQLEFDAAEGSNGDDDFVQAALMFGGRLFQPAINVSLGAGINRVDRSEVRRSVSGAQGGVRRARHSEVELDLEQLTDDEGLTALFTEWLDRRGPFARVFVILETEPDKRRLHYDGGAFVGTVESFDAVGMDEEPGYMAGVFVTKNVNGVKIQETD